MWVGVADFFLHVSLFILNILLFSDKKQHFMSNSSPNTECWCFYEVQRKGKRYVAKMKVVHCKGT